MLLNLSASALCWNWGRARTCKTRCSEDHKPLGHGLAAQLRQQSRAYGQAQYDINLTQKLRFAKFVSRTVAYPKAPLCRLSCAARRIAQLLVVFMQPVLSILALHLLHAFLISELTFVRFVLPLAMIHDFVMPFTEDSQGGKASYVVIPAQVHLTSAVNLHLQHHMGAGQSTAWQSSHWCSRMHKLR